MVVVLMIVGNDYYVDSEARDLQLLRRRDQKYLSSQIKCVFAFRAVVNLCQ